MESGAGGGTKNNQGPTQSTDNSDLVAFTSAYGSTQTDQWWRDNVDLPSYYNYRSMVEAIHHWDIGFGKNYFYYHNPETNKWQQVAWDLDLTWFVSYEPGGGDAEPFKNRVLAKPALLMEYRNRLREIRDLLYNPEQVGMMIDEYAALVDRPADANGFVEADRAMWDYNPILASSYVNSSKAGNGRYYQSGTGTQDFAGMMRRMKDWVATRSTYLDTTVLTSAEEAAAPRKSAVAYAGPAGFPADALSFNAGPFVAGNQGGSFAAMQWRLADITPAAVGAEPRYEITPAWESAVLTSFNGSVSIPVTAVTPGHTYRVRVRLKDSNGRWGHWSDAVAGQSQFVVGPGSTAVRDSLRITEINYHPAPPPAGSPFEDEDFEFIEFQNIGAQPIDLANVHFDAGVEHTFAAATLAPGEVVVLVANEAAFRSRYTDPIIRIVGSYGASGTNFNNNGEPVKLVDATGATVLDFAYDDVAPWPVSADGDGPSLTFAAARTALPPAWNNDTLWRASRAALGTPGYIEPEVVVTVATFDFAAADHAMRFTFTKDVSASLSASDLVLVNTTTGQTVPAAATTVAWNAATLTASWTFAGLSGNGRLPDGNYTATLLAAGITDATGTHLDGSGIGAGTNYVFTTFALAGDANRDRRVDVSDLGILATHYQLSSGVDFTLGDFNYDGVINVNDLGLLSSNYGVDLTTDPAALTQSAQPGPATAAQPRRSGNRVNSSQYSGVTNVRATSRRTRLPLRK